MTGHLVQHKSDTLDIIHQLLSVGTYIWLMTELEASFNIQDVLYALLKISCRTPSYTKTYTLGTLTGKKRFSQHKSTFNFFILSLFFFQISNCLQSLSISEFSQCRYYCSLLSLQISLQSNFLQYIHLRIWISAANPRNRSSAFPCCRFLIRNCCLRRYFILVSRSRLTAFWSIFSNENCNPLSTVDRFSQNLAWPYYNEVNPTSSLLI